MRFALTGTAGLVRRSPIPYFGGKQRLAPLIVSLMPKHTTYCEVFGGSAAVLWAKPQPRKASAVEVYNDIDQGVVALFRVLRNPLQAQRLAELLELTPFARDELSYCRAHWQDDGLDDIERARQWFSMAQMSFAGRVDTDTGFRMTKGATHSPASSMRSAVDLFPAFTRRLRHVLVEHMDFRRLMAAYDSPGTLFYLDPPYMPDTRRSGGYRHEMTAGDHAEMLDIATHLQGNAIISGYDHPLYAEVLDGWQCVKVETTTSAAGRTRAEGNVGKGSIKAREAYRRVECIWISPGGVTQPELWGEL